MLSGAQNTSKAPADERAAPPEFLVVAYNVENLFDIDGESLFDDYVPDRYGPQHLLRKLQNTARVLATFRNGQGPEIILFQELENDRTPSAAPFDHAAFLQEYAKTTLNEMLSDPITDNVKDLPASAFLLKALQEAGLDEYHVAVAEYRPDPLRTVAHVNATFSRFPILETKTHQSVGARGTLEVVHRIAGHRFYTFNNHWKSGASNPGTEPLRVGNAQVVRDRLNELLATDPAADVLVGGDLNSLYNQNVRNPQMKTTAINDVLGSQGDELAIQSEPGPDLYNLWYELPADQRGSDVYVGEWGTLMHLLLTPGLYDFQGIQYRDNSFGVAAIDGLNVNPETHAPIRWNAVDDDGYGFSDHLPVYAEFKVVADDDTQRFIQLKNPGRPSDRDAQARKVDYASALAGELPAAAELGSDNAIRNPDLLGKFFRVQATVSGEKPFRVRIFEDDFNIWSFDRALRIKIYDRFTVGDSMDFIGELGIHDNNWQFVVHDLKWLEPGNSGETESSQRN